MATSTSNLTLILAIAVGIIANARELIASLSSLVFVAAAVVVSASGLLGRTIPDGIERRRGSSLVTLNRATSVALLVVGRAFEGNPEVFTAVVVFGLVQTVAALAVSCYWRWVSPRTKPRVAGVTR